MFESGQFTGRTDLQWQSTVLSVAVMTVLVISICYYFVVFCSEIFNFRPQVLLRIFAQTKRGKKGELMNENLDLQLGGDGEFQMIELNSNPMMKSAESEQSKKELENAKIAAKRAQQNLYDQEDIKSNLMGQVRDFKKEEKKKSGNRVRSKSRGKRTRRKGKKAFSRTAVDQ